jgi:hypothetical protein
MKTKILTLLLALALTTPALAEDPIKPDPALTPGAVLTTDTPRVCQPDYAKSVRFTTLEMKKEVYKKYDMTWEPGHYEVDHLIPLGIGGADTAENLWPESFHSGKWNAETKDRLEWKLHQLICARQLDIHEAQKTIATDWIAAYKRFCPKESDCPPWKEPDR